MNTFNLTLAIGLMFFAGASLVTNATGKIAFLVIAVVLFFIGALNAAGVL